MPKAQGRITIRRRPKDGSPGTPGADSVSYHIILSPNSISVNADGKVVCNGTSIMAKAYKNVGGVTSEANDGSMRLVYTKMDGTISDVAASGVTPTAAAAYAAVSFEYRVNNKVVASEALVINREGQPGNDAITIIVSPENVEFNYSTSVFERVVKVDVYRGAKKLIYNDDYLCSPLKESTSTPITNGMLWGFNTDDDGGFYYILRYASGNDVNIDIPFTVTVGEEKYHKVICVHTVKDGAQGLQGCIYRITQWQAGKEFRNDSALTSAELRYIDIALIPNPALVTKANAYMCMETHISSSTNAPGTSSANKYWSTLNSTAPFFMPFLLADGAAITLLQSNQVIVMKEDGSTVNVALGGGKYPLWIGHTDPTQANFYVDDFGRAHMTEAEIIGRIIAGIAEGQRVELQPENKAMKIYDANGDEVCSFEGNSYTKLSELFSSASGNFSIKNRTSTDFGFASGISYGKGAASISGNETSPVSTSKEIILSNTIQSSTPIEVTVNGYLETQYTIGDNYLAEISSEESRDGIQTEPMKPVFMRSANAYLSLRVDTYSDSTLTNRIGSASVADCASRSGGKVISNAKAKTSVGGYHVLKLVIMMSASGSGMSASVKWGSAVSAKSNISGSYLSDFYVSRYFANGFCLGMSATNYIWAYNQGQAGMRFVMENGGFGIDVSNAGIKHKHHNGNWVDMPLFVFKSRYYSSSDGTSYYSSAARSFNGSMPTVSRIEKGRIRLTFPDSWKTALAPSVTNLIVNVVGYGTISGGSNPNKAQIREITDTYIDVVLSDDETPNDGGFMINIYFML